MITQCYMSECIEHFHGSFMERWGLTPYRNNKAPALFVGMYSPERVVVGYHPHTAEQMRTIYSQCRITLQMNPFGGYTSTREMAHMGRPAVTNRKCAYAHGYANEQELFKAIDYLYDNNIDTEQVAKQARESLTTSKHWLK